MPNAVMKAPRFFEFRQNNSGGSFDHNENLSVSVIIEATDAQDANARAEALGMYWDGAADDRDCECCGDRWYALYDTEQGDEVPSLYCKALDLSEGVTQYNPTENRKSIYPSPAVIVHFLDGRKLYFERNY